MRRPRTRIGAAAVAVGLLAVLCALFLAWIGIDALEGRNDFNFFADSPTYHEAAGGGLDHVDGWVDLVGVAANYLGPVLLLRFVAENYYAVMALNALLLLASVSIIARALQLDALRLLGLLLINPLTVSSVLAVNKEILSLVFVALVLHGCVRRSVFAIVAAAALSLLVRWQLTVFLVVALLLVSPLNPFARRRGATLVVLLVALSLAYMQFADVLEPIRLNFELAAEDYEGSGLYQTLVEWQDRGWYWAVFPVKAAHLLFGLGLRFDRLLQPTDIYNDVWQLLHSMSLLLMAVLVWHAGRLRLANDLVYLSVIYVAVFALSPIYAPRYFYPVYVLWAVALAARSPWPFVLTPPRHAPRAAAAPAGAGLSLPNR
jgi:hypothetical protein